MAESDSNEQLVRHLKDVHAMEEQAIKTLERAVELSDDEDISGTYEEHLEQSREHSQQINERIKGYDLEPSAVKDLTMRSGAIGLRQLAEIPPDTPVKLAMHVYAFEHLEIAAYEFLLRIAREAGDDETAEAAERILEQEREAAEKVQSMFDRCAELLGEQQRQAEEEAPADDEQGSAADEEKDSAAEEDKDSAEQQGPAQSEDADEKEASPA